MSAPGDVLLRWEGRDLVFSGGAEGGPRITVDSAGVEGPSPMQLLLLSLAGCMGIDVRLILEKSRVPVDALEVSVSGERADAEPRRYTSIRLVYRVAGPEEAHTPKLERAVALSRDKYCSVLHTLDPALAVDIRIERQ